MIKILISFAISLILSACTRVTPIPAVQETPLHAIQENTSPTPKPSLLRHKIHYFYAHKILPNLFLSDPQKTIKYIEQDGNKFLQQILVQFQSKIKREDQLDISELTYSLIEEESYKVFLIQLPYPLVSPEAYYVGMVVNNIGYDREYRYFTLEKTPNYKGQKGKLDNFFCEWTSQAHRNYGIGLSNPPSKDDFLLLIRHLMKNTQKKLKALQVRTTHSENLIIN